MKIIVREMRAEDRAAWASMRAALWPEEDTSVLAQEIGGFLGSDEAWGFIAETADGAPVGFAELAIRNYANGCETQPVPFLEGIWVKDEFRRQGIGARLIRYVEAFLVARGYRELGSDALIDNAISHKSHCGWGFPKLSAWSISVKSWAIRALWDRKESLTLAGSSPARVSWF
jgi:aminoglycoside 6'-N-acetyltransferase I